LKKIQDNKQKGEISPCLIIAEAGVNHNGSLEIAKKLVDVAKDAGANIVKFQSFYTDELVSVDVEKAVYQIRAKEKTQYEMLKNLELSFNDTCELKEYCDVKHIEFMSTPYDIKSVELLDEIGVKRFKIASADLINKPLIEAVANKNKQIILGCGMCTLGEIERTISFIESLGINDIILLHCTTNYPTPYDQVNMHIMKILKKAFMLPVGYSDHTLGIIIPIMAVSLGAKIIEKHITLDRLMQGPDHFASLEPTELKNMITAIRNIEIAFGINRKIITKDEKNNILFMRRSLHLRKDVKIGDIISKDLIKITRPFDGIEPWFLDKVLGKKIKNDLNKNQPIKWEDLL